MFENNKLYSQRNYLVIVVDRITTKQYRISSYVFIVVTHVWQYCTLLFWEGVIMSVDTASSSLISMFSTFGFLVPILLGPGVIMLRKLYLRITKDKRPINIFGGPMATEESQDVKDKIQVNRYRMNNYNVEGNK